MLVRNNIFELEKDLEKLKDGENRLGKNRRVIY